MGACKFCGETVSDGARKCQKCGEPQGWGVWPMGMLLRYVPLASVAVAGISLTFACLESQAARRAEAGEEQAVMQKVVAEEAVMELARELPGPTRDRVLERLELAPGTTVEQLEKQTREDPEDVTLQRKAVLFRALREPDEVGSFRRRPEP